MKWLDEVWKKDIVKIKEKFSKESEYQEIKRKQNQKKLIIAIIMALAIGFLVYILMRKFYSHKNIIAKIVSFMSSIIVFILKILSEKIFDQFFSRLFRK